MSKKPKKYMKAIKTSIWIFLGVLYFVFIIALSFGSAVAGVFTVIPAEVFGWEVSNMSALGYYSVCSFAPFSTVILFCLSFLGFILLTQFVKYLSKKSQKIKYVINLKDVRL